MRTYTVTTARSPFIYLGEYFARDRPQAKYMASKETGFSLIELKAVICREAV